MKITTQLLRSRARRALSSLEFLDLSNQEIDCIDKLHLCPNLRVLNLRGNSIDYVSNLDHCTQLWKLDLANNKIKNLDGVRRFVAMGTLVLSNNDLNWQELAKLRHMHILDLSLHGNQQLEKDPYYRIHVIDTLPNVWMLDGRVITSAERVQAQQFFQDSALSNHPVRHKHARDKFTPSNLKKIEVSGVFGERTDHLMRRFPLNGALNIDTDRRRLKYLAYNIQEDLCLESKNTQRNYKIVQENRTFLEELLSERSKDRVRCNMMLLLLVASLEFAIPVALMKEALACTKLNCVGNTSTMHLFLLPREIRCLVVSLLLSAVKVDKDVGEDGGLYDKLYLCLYYSISELTKLSQGAGPSHHNNNNNTPQRQYSFFRDSKCLIASEVVQLLCIVPAFFSYLSKDTGVMNLVAIATSNPDIIEQVQQMANTLAKDKMDQRQICETVSQVLLAAIHHNGLNLLNTKTNTAAYILNTSKAIPKRNQSNSLYTSEYHATGRTCPVKTPVRLKSGKHERRPFIPVANLGEKVLLGPQNVGRVISVPEPDLVLIQMDDIPADSGAMIHNSKNPEEHYTYVDMTQLFWDNMAGYWRPKGTVGDRITLQPRGEEVVVSSADGQSTTSDTTGTTAPTPRTPLPAGGPGTGGSDGGQHTQLQIPHEFPEAVSSKYKQQWNLKLEWKSDDNDDGNSAPEPPGDLAVDYPQLGESEGVAEAQDRRTAEVTPRNSNRPNSTQSPRAAKSPAGRVTPRQAEDNLYKNLQSAIFTVKQTIPPRPPQPTPTQRGHKPTSPANRHKTSRNSPRIMQNGDVTSTATQWGSAMPPTTPADDPGAAPDEPRVPLSSRRSSLESVDEPELQRFLEASRPGSGVVPATGTPAVEGIQGLTSAGTPAAVGTPATLGTPGAVGTPAAPIEIPQVNDDKEDLTTANGGSARGGGGGVGSGSGGGGGERSRQEGGRNTVDNNRPGTTAGNSAVKTTGPRSISALDHYRMVVARDNNQRVFTSQYQSQRTEAWRNTHHGRDDPHAAPPPQRPPSPTLKPSTPGGPESADRQSVRVQYGEEWLGGGRDLHWERQRTRPKTAHTPGWMEGMPLRPKSAAALRALRRSRTPNIITPSSIAYQSLYALEADEHTWEETPHYVTPRGAGENQMTGSKLVSHPFAKYVYVMRERNKAQQSVMCQECRSLHARQEAELKKILGGANSELIERLVALEPCSHTGTPETASEGLPAIHSGVGSVSDGGI